MYTQNNRLSPLFCARNKREFDSRISGKEIKILGEHEKSLISKAGEETSFVDGFCIPCGRDVSFRVDMQAGGRREEGLYFPNWRERLICPGCVMSNRQRLIAAMVIQRVGLCAARQNIYLMERTTSLYKWVANRFDDHSIVGSEYFGAEFQGGKNIGVLDYQAPLKLNNLARTLRHRLILYYSMLRMGGIRHEDITRLSFPDTSLDLIVSNDVFEHVPDPWIALKECSRVLRPGGQMLATIPFHSDTDKSVSRAVLEKTGIHHWLPPVYHGNPISAGGSLVFTDFGWDILQSFLEAGFSDGVVEVYGSAKYGHLGGGQIIFRVTK